MIWVDWAGFQGWFAVEQWSIYPLSPATPSSDFLVIPDFLVILEKILDGLDGI